MAWEMAVSAWLNAWLLALLMEVTLPAGHRPLLL